MRGVDQYVVFILLVSLILAGVYFTVISSFFARNSFTYQYGTSSTQPLHATESSDGVVVSFRALEGGVVTKFSLKGEKVGELRVGEYPAITSVGDDIIILDDASGKLIRTNGKLERTNEVGLDGAAMRRIYTTRSRILIPIKIDGTNSLAFYDFYLERMNVASLPALPVLSQDVYAYTHEGSCYVGILERDITELPECESIAISKGKYIFALVNGKRIIKFNSMLEQLDETPFAFEGKYISSRDSVYVASDTKIVKYDFNLNEQECEVSSKLSGAMIWGFSDKGHYVLAQAGQQALVAVLE